MKKSRKNREIFTFFLAWCHRSSWGFSWCQRLRTSRSRCISAIIGTRVQRSRSSPLEDSLKGKPLRKNANLPLKTSRRWFRALLSDFRKNFSSASPGERTGVSWVGCSPCCLFALFRFFSNFFTDKKLALLGEISRKKPGFFDFFSWRASSLLNFGLLKRDSGRLGIGLYYEWFRGGI